jgi:outer membrane protein OmpA-like peptidoglycan-associated protein
MKRAFLFLLSCSMIAGVYAQDVETAERYSVSGGLLGAVNLTKFNISGDNPTNVDFERKTGWSAGGWVNFPIGQSFSIEPQLMYSSYRYLTNSTTTPLLLTDGKISYISLPVLLKFHAANAVAITLGPQFDFLSSVDDDDNLAVDEDFNKTSVSLSAGLELFPRSRVSVFGRYIHGLSDLNESDNHTTMEWKNSNIQLGLKLRLFGGSRQEVLQATDVPVADTDGDGINDQLDKCPNVAGVAKYDGCPVPDTDGDGINDELDQCPTQAGTAKYNGCPVPDTDGDGINDELDKCPTQAGPADRNGCPVTDRDNDGINDDNDRCPDIAGTTANNGCPDVPANVTKSLGTIAPTVSFGNNNATLTTKSMTSLDRLVTLLNENPTMHIRIEGHTSNVGDAEDLEELSEDRAKAVEAYLISKGIDEDRIDTKGYGGTMPIADNTTAAGRARNQRIEIKLNYGD